MTSLRFSAIREIGKKNQLSYQRNPQRVSEFFGEFVFTGEQLRAHLSSDLAEQLEACISGGEKISTELANSVANALKSWAISKGATHYTHWFHPLRGTTAEKHDTFFELKGGLPVENFKGTSLVQQEPDASSFPSGGIRSTFEARGYTAWDPGSPAFIYETGGVRTLCIPTVFVSYNGDALDHKTPLLKAIDVVNNAATRVCQLFDKNVSSVRPSLGAEQEYFLIDRGLYLARPDLIMTGRTIFGHSPARGQQLSDHYFGSIPRRVTNFMIEFETEALRLGIPVRTRHNEVAPGQFEVAPQYEEANLASDHNMLLMDVMERIAEKHGFKMLFHEKPFKGINGSGKHNNWALITNEGRNLLAPSSKPRENLQFLTFLVCTIKAVYTYADLLRASIASASNDLRLGAHEAPPAIISIFLGSQLTAFIENLEKNAAVGLAKGDNMFLKLGISKIPEILQDNTDRNRTSPFAFTGNKFEFRAVGSNGNCSDPMTILNTAVAEILSQFYAEALQQIEQGTKKEFAIIQILQEYIRESKAILFEGDNYSENWTKEAAKRGLSNFSSTPEALTAFKTPTAKALFARHGIFTEMELEARTQILLEEYILKVQIESRVCGDLAQNHILPVALRYQNFLLENIQGLQLINADTSCSKEIVEETILHISQIRKLVVEMTNARKDANKLEETWEKADAYAAIRPLVDQIRYHVDKLELLIDDREWPLPKYRELLFLR
jgi:glutamine synthetase